MAIWIKRISLLLGFMSVLGFLPAQERQTSLAGRSASPLFDQDGRFVIAYQNAGNGLGLAGGAYAAEEIAVYDHGPAPSVLSPVIKKDRAGDIGIVWEQRLGGKSEIYFGRIKDGRLLSARRVFQSRHLLFSPDLDFDEALNPWISWIEWTDQGFYVRVANLGLNTIRIVNGPFFSSALTPKLLANGDQGVWVFWTGRDKGRDEIFGSLYQGDSWSPPYRLNKDRRYPHLSPSAGLDGNGRPWVVWSAYDGRDYEIFCSSWDGKGWSAEKNITDNSAADSSPAISFVFGTIPLVVWSQSSGRTSALCAKLYQGASWSPEIQIVPGQRENLRSPRIAVLDDRLGITWESGEHIESVLLSYRDLIGKEGRAVPPPDSVAFPASSRDENQYTGFGDSITAADNQGYTPRLELLLLQKYGATRVWNEGWGGETTVEGLLRIDESIAAHRARYFLLMEGTNDIIFLDISMDTTAFDLEEMARRCLQAGMRPLIATIIPRNDWHWYSPVFKNRILDLNDRIRSFSVNLKIVLVDEYNVFYGYSAENGGWQSLLISDGVHPNSAGFQVMAEAWFKGINIEKSGPGSPQNLVLDTRLDDTETGKINILAWQANPLNAYIPLQNHKIYRKQAGQNDDSFSLIASVSPAAHQYEDTNTEIKIKYTYRVTAVSQNEIESVPSSSVTETKKFEFPPLNPAVRTAINKLLFYREKVNTLAFEQNDLNDEAEVSGTKVYRRNAAEDDEKFALLATLNASTLSYTDRRLPMNQKYAYAVTTLYADGRESRRSEVVTDK